MSEGFLREILRKTSPFGGFTPQNIGLTNNEVVITITEEEFKRMAFANLTEDQRARITVRILNGRIEIRIRVI